MTAAGYHAFWSSLTPEQKIEERLRVAFRRAELSPNEASKHAVRINALFDERDDLHHRRSKGLYR